MYRDNSEPLSSRILRVVMETPGIRSAHIASRLGRGTTVNSVSVTCRDLVYRGLLKKTPETPTGQRGHPHRSLWWPTAQAISIGIEELTKPRLALRVEEAVRAGHRTTAAISQIVGASMGGTRNVLLSLERDGVIAIDRRERDWRYYPADDEEENWKPRPYINPIRARALGLK